MKNGGGHFAPELGGHFELESGGHFKLELGGQYHWNLQLSHSGLKFYFENDKKEFEKIKKRYLSKRWASAEFETQIKEIAHNIRNKNSNQSIKQSRIHKPQQVNMFSCFD